MKASFRPGPKHILFALILCNLILGLFIADDFGISTDENHEGKNAEIAYQIYFDTSTAVSKDSFQNGVDKYYGTATTIVPLIANRICTPILDVHSAAITHYTYYIFFQISLAAFFFLAAMFIPEWYALLLTIIFGTQPLLFGHAFINPKDIPLLAVFMATIASGFYFVDHLAKTEAVVQPAQSSRMQKFLIFLLAAVLGLLVIRNHLSDWTASFISYAYQAPETNIANRIFKWFTTSGSLKGYLILGNLLCIRSISASLSSSASHSCFGAIRSGEINHLAAGSRCRYYWQEPSGGMRSLPE